MNEYEHTRIIRRLRPEEIGKYPCYLCSRGADSFLESTATKWVWGAPVSKTYTLCLCQVCVRTHGIDAPNEWNPVERQENHSRSTTTEETPDMWSKLEIDEGPPR